MMLVGCSNRTTASVRTASDVTAYYNAGMHDLAGSGGTFDFVKAAQNLDVAAEPEKYVSHDFLGDLYADVTGRQSYVPPGNAEAQRSLALLYFEGQGVDLNQKKAADLLSRAVQSDDPASEAQLGIQYERGKGVPKDLVKAYALFSLAADQRDDDGRNGIKRITPYMTAAQIQQAQTLAQGMTQTIAQTVTHPTQNPHLIASILGLPTQQAQAPFLLADLFGGSTSSAAEQGLPPITTFDFSKKMICHPSGAGLFTFTIFESDHATDCTTSPCGAFDVTRKQTGTSLVLSGPSSTPQWTVEADGRYVESAAGEQTSINGICENAY